MNGLISPSGVRPPSGKITSGIPPCRLFTADRIAVKFEYEWRDAADNWFRSYGNELWEFDAHGLMRRREASINDRPIVVAERKFFWPAPGPRPADHPGIE